MNAIISGISSGDDHISVRTSCGRDIRVGHLSLGGSRRPVHRVSLSISASSDAGDGTWAGLTAGEARQLAGALLAHAATCDALAAAAARALAAMNILD
ncbi:MAG TPA: hypothetical protein VKV35_02905 [Streptosporangiaceae bacterium]|jgi:hypothetical protein|nr:hypothetical protein [Streptosporangiaceae bacterium]